MLTLLLTRDRVEDGIVKAFANLMERNENGLIFRGTCCDGSHGVGRNRRRLSMGATPFHTSVNDRPATASQSPSYPSHYIMHSRDHHPHIARVWLFSLSMDSKYLTLLVSAWLARWERNRGAEQNSAGDSDLVTS